MEAGEYDLLASIEDYHWFYVARRGLVTGLIERCVRPARPLAVLDVGCGTGGTTAGLRRFGTVAGCDVSPLAVAHAQRRGLAGVRLQTDPGRLPFPDGAFDLVTALDVLEHADDDAGLLREVRRVLKPGGAALLTVPAYPALWSVHDVADHHRRRYRRAELLRAVGGAGLAAEYVTHFNGFLLPLIVPVRWARDKLARGRAPTTDFHLRLPSWLESTFGLVFAAERFVLRSRSLPFGLTLCVVARS